MADKKMHRGVRVGTVGFRPGDEDALDEALTKDEAKRLLKAKVISGDFTGKRKDDEPVAVTQEPRNPDATAAAGDVAEKRRAAMRKSVKNPAERPAKQEIVKTGEGDPLGDDFPGKSELEAAGVATVQDVVANVKNLEQIEGVGPKTAKAIREHITD